MRSFLLGAKTEVKGWTNPYITDGLVAMWDGEWNAGGGVHDASAAEWTDIVGGLKAAMSSATFEPKFVNKTFAGVAYDNMPISGDQASVASALSGDCTFEIVLDVGQREGNNPELIKTSDSSTVLIRNNFSSSAPPSNVLIRMFRGMFKNKDVANDGTFQHVRWAFTVDGTSGHWFNNANGQTDTWTATAAGANPSLYGVFSANRGRIYALRIYNRALTAAEVAANYAVDQRRFSL